MEGEGEEGDLREGREERDEGMVVEVGRDGWSGESG